MRNRLLGLFLLTALWLPEAFALEWGELEGRIRDTLESLHLGRHSIESEYRSGTLTVSGYVTKPADKERVVHSLALLPGITTVDDKLEVRGGPSGVDESIHRAALDAVKSLTGLGSYEMDLESEDGRLFLTGTVASEKDRKRIEQAVRTAVSAPVENRLLLAAPPADSLVEKNVWAALRRESDLDLSGVTIASRDGVVTVRGTKPNHRVIDRILSIANMADGVREVRSEMRLGR